MRVKIKQKGTMRKTEVEPIFAEHGFELEGDSWISPTYVLDIGHGWKIRAHCSYFDNMFQVQEVDREKLKDEVEVYLDKGGPHHVVRGTAGLEEHLPTIVKRLKKLAQNPEPILCKTCGTRYLGVKQKNAGGHFMSCSGWDEKWKGLKGTCQGSDHRMPTHVHYPE